MYKHFEEDGHIYAIRIPRHQPYDRQLYRQETEALIRQSLEGGLEKVLKPESNGDQPQQNAQ
jgi:hypothetical protein